MTAIVHNSKTLALPLKERTGTRRVIAWSCTRKARSVGDGRMLEQLEFVLSVQPLDHSHAMIEAWLESRGDRLRTIHPARQHRCQTTDGSGMLHIDARNEHGECLAMLSLASRGDREDLLYARTVLLAQAGFVAGGYDAPGMRDGRSV
jgi:hypothetical protein